MIEAPAFPDAAHVLTTLHGLQVKRAQMALVINENGGAEGIFTIEDLIEELVGEIYDETDADLTTVRHEPYGTVVIPGRFPIHDLPDIGVDVADGDYPTVAGLVLDGLGRIPALNDTLVVDGWSIDVRAVHRHSITEVALHCDPDSPSTPDRRRRPSAGAHSYPA